MSILKEWETTKRNRYISGSQRMLSRIILLGGFAIAYFIFKKYFGF